MLPISFECLEFAFECFECFQNGLNLHLNASNTFRMVRICIRIPFVRHEFGFECFESLSNGSNQLSNASNLVRSDGNSIRMLRIWLELPFECFESLSNGSNFHSNASNPFRKVMRICIQMLQIPFEGLEFAFKCFESLRVVSIWIRMIRIPIKRFEFGFQCFESRLNGQNLHTNPSNLVQRVRICNRMIGIWLELAIECQPRSQAPPRFPSLAAQIIQYLHGCETHPHTKILHSLPRMKRRSIRMSVSSQLS